MAPALMRPILEKALLSLRDRANANGECYGGEILDCVREAGIALGVSSIEVVLTRGVLMRAMEAEGALDPAGMLQDYENRVPVSEALRYLRRAIARNTSNAAASVCFKTP